jgi:TonB family protein
MLKSIFLLTICLFFCREAFAQKRDTSVYYLKNSGKVVSSKDSADYFLVILPPDATVDKNLYIVKEFYSNGRLKLMTGSKSNKIEKLMFQGSYIAFYPNGRKMLIGNYEKGEVIGDETEYYPNGKLYNIRSYKYDGKVFLKQYNDSTGNALAENGKGKWKVFSDNFKIVSDEGEVNNGVQDGVWIGRINDSVDNKYVYDNGKLISNSMIYKFKHTYNGRVYSSVDVVPEFQGGIEAFGQFIAHNVHYPAVARENNTQGRIIVSFIVEKDGRLTDVKIASGIGDGCDEEAIRVMKLSPPWKPGMVDGKPVRVAYSVPISFTLGNNN